MGTQKLIDTRRCLLYFLLPFIFILSCKKDTEEAVVVPFIPQRVTEVIFMRGGLNDYREVYHYDGNQLSDYYAYRYSDKGEWKEWHRFLFEYPTPDDIILIRYGISDSNWFPSHKWEKHFTNDQFSELKQYNWDYSNLMWKPFRKYTWDHDQGRLLTRRSYEYENTSWIEYERLNCLYTGNLWMGIVGLDYNGIDWDSAYQHVATYSDGKLREVKTYWNKYSSGWSIIEQILLDYESDNVCEIIVNTKNDTLIWSMTETYEYNKYGNISCFVIDHACCPTETTIVTYEDQVGNYKRATTTNSDYGMYPWVPAPVKK